MKAVIAAVSLLLVTTSAEADWQNFDANIASPLIDSLEFDATGSELLSVNADSSITIDAPAGQAVTVPLGTFTVDGMKSRTYALQLWIDYSVGSAPAYFEMWTTLERGDAFFSKTLGSSGPMAHLLGDRVGREVIVPASLEGSAENAVSSSLSLVLPEGGKVTIHKARMLDVPVGLGIVTHVAGQWFPAWMGGVLGGIFGVVFGCLGSFYQNARRTGRCWSVMQRFPLFMGCVAGLSLVAAMIGFAIGQPYHVWYPLGLMGVLGGVLAPVMQRQAAKQLQREDQSFEDRQMQAMDAT